MTTAQPSAPPTRRERNRARRHDAIEAAALALFTEQGYEGTTVEDIAERADVSMRTFFRYFATKDQTVFNDLPPTDGAISQQILTRPSTEDPWTKLNRSYCAIARRHSDDELQRIRTRYRLIRATPALLARHAEHNRQEQREVVRALLEADPEASADDLALLVSVAYTTIWHAVDRWAATDSANGGGENLADALERTFDKLPRALLAGASAAPQTPTRP